MWRRLPPGQSKARRAGVVKAIDTGACRGCVLATAASHVVRPGVPPAPASRCPWNSCT
ncbi:hypothetical protein RGE_05790 [Rubrivivax gelatinosus IL144]|uniref:Uncharacterized protein n=1 Tax=Rubrivivax gelatinosus (strain NBRC 100245 / IL144) TaxID=983917 RepID=I0HLN7_RUBGI|nr:hypothetical protein RGE_05790 [Rubrivivax gelatinosus IL144]